MREMTVQRAECQCRINYRKQCMGRLVKDMLAAASGRKQCSSPEIIKVHRPASKGHVTCV